MIGSEIDNISNANGIRSARTNFKQDNNGAKSFTWTPPYGATGKWVCENPSVTLVAHNINDIDLVFREVFEV